MNLPVTGKPDDELELVFVDYETFYSSEYSLTSMDPPSYILDPRFEAICLGVCRGTTAPPSIVDGPDIPNFLNSLGPRVAMVSHNALFDMAILSWRYGYVPKLIIDTLAMARTLLAHKLRKLALGSVAEYLGLQKGDMIHTVKGMTRADIIANGLQREHNAYCMNDTALCRAIFLHLLPQIPPEELILHDIVARCAVEPVLKLDMEQLEINLAETQQRKHDLFLRAMFAGLRDRDQLMSNDEFAELLRKLDVAPPRKVSKTTGKTTWAFSKQDPAFLELLHHEDPRVPAVVEARLAFKSTIEETRSQRMLNIGRLEFPHHGGTEVMPIPLVIGAAHTHRLGGGWQLNCQNWGRKSRIRKAIKAPPGHKIVVADKRQIEARMNAWFCGETELLEQFRKGVDVYSDFASDIYGFRVNKDEHPKQRFVGKTGVLQLGYQAGPPRFRASVWLQSFEDEGGPIELSFEEADNVVNSYRKKYNRIKDMWYWLPRQFGVIQGREPPVFWKCITFTEGKIEGPTGLPLFYNNLRHDAPSAQWLFDFNGYSHKLYGGKWLENIIQWLARLDTMGCAVRLKKPLEEYFSRLTHSSHDEIVYVVPDEYVGIVVPMIEAEMTRTPDWAPGLPLAVDIGIGDTYGDAK